MISTRDGVVKFSEAGVGKAKMSTSRMFVLAFMAGLFIAFAGLASTAATISITVPSIAKLVTALIFPAGLAMVVTNGTELFTGDNLLVISVLDKRLQLRYMLKNWVVVYIGNLAGSIFFTAMGTGGHVYSMFDNDLARNVLVTASTKCNLSFTDAFIKAIFCNVLVCAAVMMSMVSESLPGKIIALYLPIMTFVICGFEHSVANMSYISGGLFINAQYGNLGVDVSGLNWYNFLITNLVPVTLGNILGGSALGVMYWFTYERKTK